MLKKFLKGHKSFIAFITVLLLCFFFLRFLHLPQSIEIGSDSGRDFLAIWNIYTTKKLTLIGPPSQFDVHGHQFYFGPASYYTILPAMILGKGNVFVISSYLIILNALVLLLTLWILYRSKQESKRMYIFGFFLTVTPALIEYSRSYWNPYLMLPITTLVIGILVKITQSSKVRPLWYITLGLFCGIGLQMEFSFFLALCVVFLTLVISRKLTLQGIAFAGLGFLIGVFPLILFDIRNHFYNTHTFLLTLTQNNGPHKVPLSFYLNSILPVWINFKTPLYYGISLVPFYFFAFSYLLTKISFNKIATLFVIAILFLYGFLALSLILPVPNHGFNTIEGWNYEGLEKTADIIVNQKPVNFNIYDQLTTDNNAYALRYLLTTRNVLPQGINGYARIHNLFVYTRLSEKQLMASGAVEIDAAGPHKIVKKWEIQNGIHLYKVVYHDH